MTYSMMVGKYKLIFSDTHFKDFRKKPTISVYDADTNSETKIASFNSQETFEWFIEAVVEADRKTENSSEKPNNCETCKFEIYWPEMCEGCCEWDSHYEPKDEPQTDWHYDEQDATWYPYKHEDEPQQKSCATCKHALGNWDGESNNCGRCCGADRRFYEPKDEPKTERSSE